MRGNPDRQQSRSREEEDRPSPAIVLPQPFAHFIESQIFAQRGGMQRHESANQPNSQQKYSDDLAPGQSHRFFLVSPYLFALDSIIFLYRSPFIPDLALHSTIKD